MAIQPGTDIGRYHILEQLGEGGMATVYKAYDTRLDNEVAIKFIRAGAFPADSLPRILKRFQIEARKMAQLTHPNIVPVTDYGEFEGSPYLVMRYLPGGTLKRMMGSPILFAEAVKIIIPIADALGYAHSKGIIHRDIKPSNILITEGGQPLLSDFGVAKVLESEETLDLTATSMGVGTPEYMAPEMGVQGHFDHRSDIYSLGVVLYEMITGRVPFTADTPIAVLFKHVSDPLPRPGLLVNGLPEAVERLLFKALAKDPADRFSDMGSFKAGMEALLSGKVSPSQKAAKPEKDRVKREQKPAGKLLLGAAGLIGVGLIIFAGMRLMGGQKESITAAKDENEPTPTQVDSVTTPELNSIDENGRILIPEGEFEMGSDSGNADERPAHTVHLDAYWLDQTEVTNSQYHACVNKGGCTQPRITSSHNIQDYFWQFTYNDHPVINVTWDQAAQYCEWVGGHLPTEAEWEKAARGTDGRTYPWGNSPPNKDTLNYNSYVGDTARVGSYPSGASPYGVLDMAGNVDEWVADWYIRGYYEISEEKNPQGPDNGSRRVLRGGSWSDEAGQVRTTYRLDYSPDSAYDGTGFRCAYDGNKD